jgi:hypothetical protein
MQWPSFQVNSRLFGFCLESAGLYAMVCDELIIPRLCRAPTVWLIQLIVWIGHPLFMESCKLTRLMLGVACRTVMERRPLRTVLAFIEKNRSENPFLKQFWTGCLFASPYHQCTILPFDHIVFRLLILCRIALFSFCLLQYLLIWCNTTNESTSVTRFNIAVTDWRYWCVFKVAAHSSLTSRLFLCDASRARPSQLSSAIN